MAASSFPLLDLPVELQLLIWEHCIHALLEDYAPGVPFISKFFCFTNYKPFWEYEIGHGEHRRYIRGENFQIVGPRSGKVIYVPYSWYNRKPFVKLLNTCCMARLVTWRWIWRIVVEERLGPVEGGGVKAFLDVSAEFIEDLNGRLGV